MFTDKLKELIGDYDSFLDLVFSALETANIKRSELNELDHIGYSLDKLSEYNNLKKQLNSVAHLHSEYNINGKNISLYRLTDPIIEKGFIINYLELISSTNKLNNYNGIEHAEFVLNDTLERFFEKHNNLKWDALNNKNQNENRELILQCDGFSLVFHEKSLVDFRDEHMKK